MLQTTNCHSCFVSSYATTYDVIGQSEVTWNWLDQTCSFVGHLKLCSVDFQFLHYICLFKLNIQWHLNSKFLRVCLKSVNIPAKRAHPRGVLILLKFEVNSVEKVEIQGPLNLEFE